MNISRDEILHIANLADLNLTEDEINKYQKDMEEILAFANTINSANTNNIDESIGATTACNRFRKDEVKEFENRDGLLQNAPSKEDGMFHIPNVM